MRVSLLYKDHDRLGDEAYYDAASIIQDLGLKTLFLAAAKKLIYENGKVKKVEKEDSYLAETMRKVMMIPLSSKEEIEYRQAVMRDGFGQEEMLRGLYEVSCDTLKKWNELGRSIREKAQQSNPVTKLISEIRVLHLFCDSLKKIRELFTAEDPGTGRPVHEALNSEGFRSFYERFNEAFPPEREAAVRKVLQDISFYTDGSDEDEQQNMTVKPKIVLECGLEDGLKFSSLKLAEVASESVKFYRPGSTMKKLQEFKYSRIPDSFPVEKEARLREQAKQMEYGVVSFLAESVMTGMMEDFQTFFDQLRQQAAFYLGAVQLKTQMERFGMDFCFPEISDRRTLEFQELREFVMAVEQRVNVIGNTCSMDRKDLLIVTGANQGGKSTFLRSIGIAQVMMQCGLLVTAKKFRSGIFPRIFVHFTRREDSSMNSGRLDEELNRMNRIVEQIGDGSLLLLNESFATTTEKDGSVIAYDIIKALNEAGVKILTVTHLLSFARRVYEEAKENPESGVEFLSAERMPDGTRTFRMVQHAPELTSFGLDLYEEIVEKKTDKKAGNIYA
ncbi:MAG: hypothetical protein J6Z35_02310 [Lachnospiraceae bacterium]|nr:hypothetical protein [Lachnospiraceae bacterium]